MRKQVLIINTGGTIGMRRTADGYRPQPGFLKQQMAQIPELSDPSMPTYEIFEFDPVLDSANMTPGDWQRIGREIQRGYEKFDGFLILHGTDTMAFTASALAFTLRGLARSVILTGSQLPLCELRNDARENLLTAMILASRFSIPEVCIFFGSRLLRGCRATKSSTTQFDAFDSPNFPPLGTAGTDLEVFNDRLRPVDPSAKFQLMPLKPVRIATVRLFPGLSIEVLRHALHQPLEAVILQTFGVGNGPTNNPEFVDVIAAAAARGILVVNLTQCHQGHVAMAEYATGGALASAGVVSGADMTFEAAVTKLQYLFSQNLSGADIRREFVADLAGELTV
jgi:L-asparaginase